MKKLLFLVFIGMAGFSNALAQSSDGIHWKTWSELERAYNEEPKPVLLFFHAEWCAYCKKIEREIFTKQKVIDEINDEYYAVQMDVETKDTITFNHKKFVNKQSLTQRNGVHEIPLLLASREGKPFSLPATVILNKKFKVKKRVFEYYTSEQLLSML
jgi:thioredoxin-related protein